MRRRGALGAIGSGATALAAMLAGCDRLLTTKVRCRLTARLSVHGKLCTGMSVIEIGSQPEIMPMAEGAKQITWVNGEALVIPTPSTTLFVTLDVPEAGTLPVAIVESFAGKFSGAKQFAEKLYLLTRQVGRTVTLQPVNFPTIVYFQDPARPDTITPINLPEGNGITPVPLDSLRIELQITTEAVTRGIYTHLPWLKEIPEERHFKSTRYRFDDSYAGKTTRSTLIRGE